MTWANPNVYDQGLNWLQSNVNRLWIQGSGVSSGDMQAYAASNSAKFAEKTSYTLPAVTDASPGRRIVCPEINDGVVTVNESVAARYQLVTSDNAIALWQTLNNSQELYVANGFTLTPFNIDMVSASGGWLNDSIFNTGLSPLQNLDGKRVWLLSQAPVSNTFASANSVRLAHKNDVTISAPADRAGGGREVSISQISEGEVSTQGEATHWALIEQEELDVLWAWGQLASGQIVYTANGWETTAAIKIGLYIPS